MIIKCEKCGTRFRMADEKMQPDGIKVRCAKCQAIFRALPPEAPSAPAADLVPPPAPASPTAHPEPAPTPEPHFADDFEFAAGPAQPEAHQAEGDFDFGGAGRTAATEPQGEDFDLGDFDFHRDASKPPDFAKTEPEAEPEAIDFGKAIPAEEEGTDEFGDFSFSETVEEDFAGSPMAPEQDQEAFADFSFAENQGAGAPEEEEEEFDFTPEDLGATFAEDEEEEEQKTAMAADEAPEAGKDFSGQDFSDEDFSLAAADESSEPRPSPAEKLAPGAETTDAAFSAKAAGEKPSTSAADRLQPQTEEAAAPLVPRPAPRKSPVASLMVFLLVLLIVLTAITGYLFWQKGPQAFEQLILGLTGEKAVPPGPQEGIDLRALQSLFVANQEAGELFVIHGQAVNRFAEPRSAIQVKGVVYAADGKPILQQTVFCGNALSDEELRTLPYSGIEEAMNNQFGDTLSNLNVRPGQTIPFTIVFRNLPPNMSEFTVEVVDSRPVTADQ